MFVHITKNLQKGKFYVNLDWKIIGKCTGLKYMDVIYTFWACLTILCPSGSTPKIIAEKGEKGIFRGQNNQGFELEMIDDRRIITVPFGVIDLILKRSDHHHDPVLFPR